MVYILNYLHKNNRGTFGQWLTSAWRNVVR